MRFDLAITIGALTVLSCHPAWAEKQSLNLENPQWFEIQGSDGHYVNDASITGFGGGQEGYREFDLITPEGSYVRLHADCSVWDVATLRQGEFTADNTASYTEYSLEYRASNEFEQALVRYVCDYEDNRVSSNAITSSEQIINLK